MEDRVKQYLVFVRLKGAKTEKLKGHIVPKRVTANNADEAVRTATNSRIFEEEGFEIVAVEDL